MDCGWADSLLRRLLRCRVNWNSRPSAVSAHTEKTGAKSSLRTAWFRHTGCVATSMKRPLRPDQFGNLTLQPRRAFPISTPGSATAHHNHGRANPVPRQDGLAIGREHEVYKGPSRRRSPIRQRDSAERAGLHLTGPPGGRHQDWWAAGGWLASQSATGIGRHSR
jgi:hypothetical protein